MGPNGAGKSTLAATLLGHPSYQVTAGTIRLDGEDITDWPTDVRAKAGMFLAFQYPEAIERGLGHPVPAPGHVGPQG